MKKSRHSLVTPLSKGFSLVELMISLAIGSVIVIALVSLFVNASRSNRDIARNNSLIESGRFAVHTLREDAWHAGFWINHVPTFDDFSFKKPPEEFTAPALVLDSLPPSPCKPYSDWTAVDRKAFIAVPLQVYELPPVYCVGLIQDQAVGTDILVVRHAATCEPYLTGVGDCASPFAANELRFQNSLCEEELDPVTPPARRYVLSNDADDLNLRKRDCNSANPAGIRRFVSNIYYIRKWSSTSGDGIPTLVRSRFGLDSAGQPSQLPAEPLVEGVEGLRIELGIDNLSRAGTSVKPEEEIRFTTDYDLSTPTNRGDGSPDGAFIRCTTEIPCKNTQLINVVVMRLHLLARGADPVPGLTDTRVYEFGAAGSMCAKGSTIAGCDLKELEPGYRRQMFTTALRLNNIAGRRELPP